MVFKNSKQKECEIKVDDGKHRVTKILSATYLQNNIQKALLSKTLLGFINLGSEMILISHLNQIFTFDLGHPVIFITAKYTSNTYQSWIEPQFGKFVIY